MNSLKQDLLKPILDRVKKDDTLMLAIRDGYINIYYRGGNLFKITEQPTSYDFFIDPMYDLSLDNARFRSLNLSRRVTDLIQVEKWISSIPILKELMDFWFIENPKLEREYQQLVERENNRSSISGETEYFITDIEYADSHNGSKFDITAIKWSASDRKNGNKCKVAFIEMKYGDDQLNGKSGILKHIEDIDRFLSTTGNYSKILQEMTIQFNQLDELGLLNFNHCTNKTNIELNSSDRPEFIFLFANHNPRSKILKGILEDLSFKKHINSPFFDLRFYVSTDAGYGMHIANIHSYQEYMNFLKNDRSS